VRHPHAARQSHEQELPLTPLLAASGELNTLETDFRPSGDRQHLKTEAATRHVSNTQTQAVMYRNQTGKSPLN
jgi:hypothetical protein